MDTGTGRNLFEQCLVELVGVSHHLQVGNDGTVVELDELHEVVAASGTHPTLHIHGIADADNLGGFDDIFQS